MDPNAIPPIRKPGEVWIFVKGKGWVYLGDHLDTAIIQGDGSTPSGILSAPELPEKSWFTPPLEPNSVVAKIKADWMAAAAPLWMVKALNIPLHYCAPAPRYWTDRDIFYVLGSNAPVIQVRLGDPDLVDAEFAAEFGETSPLPELRSYIDPPPVPWWTPGEEEE